ncbi:MAG: SEL1-like repeat protein [Parachlamydiaceae bacterium]|nr:SEL1-like repeat protein [Parachlamydiaceae bacterium]
MIIRIPQTTAPQIDDNTVIQHARTQTEFTAQKVADQRLQEITDLQAKTVLAHIESKVAHEQQSQQIKQLEKQAEKTLREAEAKAFSIAFEATSRASAIESAAKLKASEIFGHAQALLNESMSRSNEIQGQTIEMQLMARHVMDQSARALSKAQLQASDTKRCAEIEAKAVIDNATQEAAKRLEKIMPAMQDAATILSEKIARHNTSPEQFELLCPYDCEILCVDTSQNVQEKEKKTSHASSHIRGLDEEEDKAAAELPEEPLAQSSHTYVTFKAHRAPLVLSGLKYFTDVITGISEAEKKQKSEKLPQIKIDFPRHIVEPFIKRFYTGKLVFETLNITDIITLWHLSDFIGDEALIENCQKALSTLFAGNNSALIIACRQGLDPHIQMPEQLKIFLFEKISDRFQDRLFIGSDRMQFISITSQHPPINHIAEMIVEQILGTTRTDPALFRSQLEASAKEGYFLAQHYLAFFLERGLCGFEQDLPRSAALTRQCGDPKQNYPHGMARLGQFLITGELGIPKKIEEGTKLIHISSQRGSSKGLYHFGHCFLNGIGVPQNISRAMHWFRLSANLGSPEAQFVLAEAMEHGRGIEQDIKGALLQYQQAAEGGNENAKAAILRLSNAET